MKMKDSYMIKGIAILFMIFYHLFSSVDVLSTYGLTGFSCSAETMASIASLCHICVPLYVFVGSYGITAKEMEITEGRHSFYSCMVRYKKLVKKVAFILSLLVIASFLFATVEGGIVRALWGESRGAQAVGLICNVAGLAGIFRVSWFHPSWWFLGLYITLIFSVPVLRQFTRKFGPYISIAASVLLVRTFGLNTKYDALPRYLFPVMFGIICAEFSVIEKVRRYLEENRSRKFVFLIGCVFAVPIVSYARLFTTAQYMIENILLILVLCIAIFMIAKISMLSRILRIFGRYSMSMWLVHAFVYTGRFREIIFGLKNIWVIWSAVVVLSLLCAVFLDGIYDQKNWNRIEKLYITNQGKFILSILVTAVCYAVMACTSAMSYLTNDDGGIQNLLSGNTTGSPFIMHQFVHVIIGAIVSSLYKIFPYIQWWYVYSQILMIIGIVLIHFTIFYFCGKSGISFQKTMPILLAVDGGFLLYPIANVAFTIVPAILGCGLMGIVFLMKEAKTKKQMLRMGAAVLTGYLLVFMHRQSVGWVLLCYLLLTFFGMFLSRYKLGTGIRRFAALCVVFFAATAALLGVNHYAAEKINGCDFIEFNSARAQYMDYPHDRYEENKKLYQDAGWDETLARLMSNWFFMDDRITAESFRMISENSVAASSVTETAERTLKSAFSTYRNQSLLLLWIASFFVSSVVLILAQNWKAILMMIANNLGGLLLVLYQAVMGRLLYRSLVIVVFPAFLINLWLALGNYQLIKEDWKYVKVLFYLCLAVCSLCFFSTTFSVDEKERKKNQLHNSVEIEKLALENQDHIYIAPPGTYSNINPYSIHPDSKVTNIIGWGGSSYHSKSFQVKLEKNGLSELSGDVFQKDNVLFLCVNDIMSFPECTGDSILELFLQYLKEQFHVKGFLPEESVEGIVYAYRFVFAENEDDFAFYYDIQNGAVVKCIPQKDGSP